MDDSGFDALARRAAQELGRRALLGVLTGAALVMVRQPQQAIAKKDPHHDDGGHHGGGGHNDGGGHNGGKDKKKNCQKLGGTCLLQIDDYCAESYLLLDQESYILCLSLYGECCRLYKKCKIAEGDRCIRDVNSILLD